MSAMLGTVSVHRTLPATQTPGAAAMGDIMQSLSWHLVWPRRPVRDCHLLSFSCHLVSGASAGLGPGARPWNMKT